MRTSRHDLSFDINGADYKYSATNSPSNAIAPSIQFGPATERGNAAMLEGGRGLQAERL